MKSTDKFLTGIVVAIVLIVIVAFALTLTRPAETYLPEDSPENIIQNYLLALQEEDYARAYGYLSPTLENYPPSLAEFERDIHSNDWVFRVNEEVSLHVEGATLRGDQATVDVIETRFYEGGLFDSGQSIYNLQMELTLVDGAWKIMGGDAYFLWCWQATTNC